MNYIFYYYLPNIYLFPHPPLSLSLSLSLSTLTIVLPLFFVSTSLTSKPLY